MLRKLKLDGNPADSCPSLLGVGGVLCSRCLSSLRPCPFRDYPTNSPQQKELGVSQSRWGTFASSEEQ